jgi:hypothetical protein
MCDMEDTGLQDEVIEPSALAPEASAAETAPEPVADETATESVEDAVPDEVVEEETPDESVEDETPEPVEDETPEPVEDAEPELAEAEPSDEPAPPAEPTLTPVATVPPLAAVATKAPGRAGLWFALAGLILFIAVSLTAIVGDYVALAYVPRGVTLIGRELDNLDKAALRKAIDDSVTTPAMQPLTVTGDGKSWQLDPKGIVTVDVDAMVAEAYAPARRDTMLTRLWSRVTDKQPATDVKPQYSVDRVALATWVAETAATIDRVPVDATRTVVKYAIQITPEVPGATLEQTRAVDEISTALTAEAALTAAGRTTALPITLTTPKVTKDSFKRAIVVSLSKCDVYYYEGDVLVKTYRCAPGRPAFPTPKGDFVIVRKAANSAWINPGSPWAAGMPRSIPGGPNNPMGDRKIGINSPGIFLHGIPASEYSSIGTHASHGCMRMMPSSIHDLYPRVRIGDPVYIRG